MPGFDGTGPMGLGPLTGRGMGYCAVPVDQAHTRLPVRVPPRGYPTVAVPGAPAVGFGLHPAWRGRFWGRGGPVFPGFGRRGRGAGRGRRFW